VHTKVLIGNHGGEIYLEKQGVCGTIKKKHSAELECQDWGSEKFQVRVQ